jgi:hypothetical protein
LLNENWMVALAVVVAAGKRCRADHETDDE